MAANGDEQSKARTRVVSNRWQLPNRELRQAHMQPIFAVYKKEKLN